MSLDVARGIVVVASVFLTALSGPYAQSHAAWYGLTPVDLIFPAFVTLMGAALALTLRRPLAGWRLARRTTVLVLAGLVFNATVQPGFATLRVPGVLQLLAIVGLVVVAVGRLLRRWWQPLVVAGGVFAGYTIGLLASSRTCLDGVPQPQCNLPGRIDRAVFGSAHIYAGGVYGFDPEGLLPTVGASGSALLGLVAGLLVMRRRRVVPSLLALAGGSLAVSLLLSQWLPVAKRLWTPSFATASSAAATALLAVCYLVTDVWGARESRSAQVICRLARPLVAFGRNSLLVYIGKHFVAMGLATTSVAGGITWAEVLHRRLGFAGSAEPFVYAAVLTLGWTFVVAGLHRRRWYLRA